MKIFLGVSILLICIAGIVVTRYQSSPSGTERELIIKKGLIASEAMPLLDAQIQRTEARLNFLLSQTTVTQNEQEIKNLQQKLLNDKKQREEYAVSMVIGLAETEKVRQEAEIKKGLIASEAMPLLDAQIQRTEARLNFLLSQTTVTQNEQEIKNLQQKLLNDKKQREEYAVSIVIGLAETEKVRQETEAKNSNQK